MSAVAAKQATSIIAIVFTMAAIQSRRVLWIASTDRVGNATGFTMLTHELVPGAALIATLVNPNIPSSCQAGAIHT